MKRLAYGCCSFLVLLQVGCSTDTKSGLANNVINDLNGVTSKIKAINEKLRDCIDQGKDSKWKEKGKEETVKLAHDLLDKAKSMQNTFKQTSQHRDKIPEDEQTKIAEEIRQPLENAMNALQKEHRTMKELLEKADKVDGPAITDVRKALEKADLEFEKIVRSNRS